MLYNFIELHTLKMELHTKNTLFWCKMGFFTITMLWAFMGFAAASSFSVDVSEDPFKDYPSVVLTEDNVIDQEDFLWSNVDDMEQEDAFAMLESMMNIRGSYWKMYFSKFSEDPVIQGVCSKRTLDSSIELFGTYNPENIQKAVNDLVTYPINVIDENYLCDFAWFVYNLRSVSGKHVTFENDAINSEENYSRDLMNTCEGMIIWYQDNEEFVRNHLPEEILEPDSFIETLTDKYFDSPKANTCWALEWKFDSMIASPFVAPKYQSLWMDEFEILTSLMKGKPVVVRAMPNTKIDTNALEDVEEVQTMLEVNKSLWMIVWITLNNNLEVVDIDYYDNESNELMKMAYSEFMQRELPINMMAYSQ